MTNGRKWRLSQALLISIHYQGNRQNTQVNCKTPPEHRKTFFHWSNTGRNFQSGCEVTILGDIQNSAGHSPGQPALADPISAVVWTQDDLKRSLPASSILYLRFCDVNNIDTSEWPVYSPSWVCRTVRVLTDNYVLIRSGYSSSYSKNKNTLTYPKVKVIKGYEVFFSQQLLLKDLMHAYFTFIVI